MFVGKIHNKALPYNMTNEKANRIISLSQKIPFYVWSLPSLSCYQSRDFIEEIRDFFENKINSNSNLKYVLVTLHDNNISQLLQFLNHPVVRLPKYNANVRFELLKANGKFYVRTTFDQEVVRVCKRTVCSFDEFKNVIQESIRTKCNDFNINYEYLKGFLS